MALTYKGACFGDGKDILQLIRKLAAHEGYSCSLTESSLPNISISAMPENIPAINPYHSIGIEDNAVFLEKHL